MDEKRIGRLFFISLSIAPVFPYGCGHARRISCDAFGTAQDAEYGLNSQTYGWWLNGRLYQYNDPDHIVLLRSFCMERDSTEGEAKARYTAAIGGTVMMLSDDYENQTVRERAKKYAGNKAVNHVATSQTAFMPVESAQSGASAAYTARIDEKQYIALFHWNGGKETATLSGGRAGLREQSRYSAKIRQEEKTEITEQIVVFHKFYDLIQYGDYYRLRSPGEGCSVWAFVRPDGGKALVNAVYNRVEASVAPVYAKVRGLTDSELADLYYLLRQGVRSDIVGHRFPVYGYDVETF